MAKTKIDLVSSIIEILYDGSDTSPLEELRTRNRLQLKLQKVSNARLSSILGNLEESLVCRHRDPGKSYCQNPQVSTQGHPYCVEHDILQQAPSSRSSER